MINPQVSRRAFVKSSLATTATLSLATHTLAQDNAKEDTTQWHNPQDWGVEGRAWNDTTRYYDRFPTKAEKMVPKPVWNLSRHSAGMCVFFETDSNSISIRYKLSSGNLAMPHMPATGVSGFDLYAQDEHAQWRWMSCNRPTRQEGQVILARGFDPAYRQYRIYFPLYNGVEQLEIGVSPEAKFKPIKPREKDNIVFYGTSITHGACASRPGMPHPAILGRMFNKPITNLGFSGNGRMEVEVAQLLGELNPCLYVIDCLPNMNGPMVAERAVPFVQTLRKLKPKTPIVLVEDRSFTNSRWFQSRRNHHAASRKALREAYQQLQKQGIKQLSYIPGEDLLGHDGEAANDGSHPSDLGFYRQARYMYPFLKPFVPQNTKPSA